MFCVLRGGLQDKALKEVKTCSLKNQLLPPEDHHCLKQRACPSNTWEEGLTSHVRGSELTSPLLLLLSQNEAKKEGGNYEKCFFLKGF